MSATIERVTLTHLRIALKEPVRFAVGEIIEKDAIVVSVEDSDGLVGVGECSPYPIAVGLVGLGDSADRCWDELEQALVPGLLGATAPDEEGIAALVDGWPGRSRFAVAGVETALWDRLGHVRKASIAELLGAPTDVIARGVEAGLIVGLSETVVDTLRAIETYLTEGYRRVKLAIAPGRDVEFVKAVRRQFGVELELMVDANGSYTAADLDVFRELDQHDLLMFEQPMAAGDLAGLAALQAAVATPVCIDETASDQERIAEAIDRGACRVVNLKLHRVGGFGPARAIHDYCYARGVACWVGTLPELGLGLAQGLHLAMLPNCKYPTDVAPSVRWYVDDYIVPALELAAPGVFRLPMRPGLGYQVDPAKLRRYEVRRREFVAGAAP
jgi:O-succinylbenzoate synthase